MISPSPLVVGSKSGTRTRSLGIVGCGPRGLYCLERLACRIATEGLGSGYDITVFEPSPWPGAGCVYDLRQADYLRINYAANNINAWSLRDLPRPPSLVDWLSSRREWHQLADDHLPRALAGEYLEMCLQIVVNELRGLGCKIRFKPLRVTQIEPEARQVLLEAAGNWYRFDEVVLVTGHEGWRGSIELPDGVGSKDSGSTIPHVFPVDEMLSTARVPPGSRVAMKGFSLCFIDAALALTQGRGGSFEQIPTGLVYLKNKYEPVAIHPYCRSGRPMRCKPDPTKMRLPASIRTVWNEGRKWLMDLDRGMPLSFERMIWPIVLDCAERSLRLCGVKASVAEWLIQWMEVGTNPQAVFDEMNKACDIAAGRCPVDAGWALGESWRQLYSSFSPLIERGGLDEDEWKRFLFVQKEMERIAFGPPLLNLEKLVALIRAGLVRLDAVKLPDYIYTEDRRQFVSERYSVAVDVIVDAVLPGPHDFAHDSVVGSLVDMGFARRDRVSGGIEVGLNGALVDFEGNESSNLYYFGRATEGWLLGNDSLGRDSRDGISLWASSSVSGKSAVEVEPTL